MRPLGDSVEDVSALAADAAWRRLEAELASLGSVCVAVSGGVDSSLVLTAAARVLGAERVVAFTASSPIHPSHELELARETATALGVAHEVVATGEFDDEEFRANPRERCYLCKAHLLGAMSAVAARRGCAALVDGVNRDDLGDERPGLRAATERGVAHPLVAAGVGKVEVRRLARMLAVPAWDAPQQACLASRIPYGELITDDKLRAIAAAEAVLRDLGFRQCRVRHHGAVARVEVAADEIERAAGAQREAIVARLGNLGFTYVTLDLAGFRSGSMNEV
ncbi:MAG: ATP-dependent sacrificial sulfur transferase LarE [Thermoleophilia bacterium]